MKNPQQKQRKATQKANFTDIITSIFEPEKAEKAKKVPSEETTVPTNKDTKRNKKKDAAEKESDNNDASQQQQQSTQQQIPQQQQKKQEPAAASLFSTAALISTKATPKPSAAVTATSSAPKAKQPSKTFKNSLKKFKIGSSSNNNSNNNNNTVASKSSVAVANEKNTKQSEEDNSNENDNNKAEESNSQQQQQQKKKKKPKRKQQQQQQQQPISVEPAEQLDEPIDPSSGVKKILIHRKATPADNEQPATEAANNQKSAKRKLGESIDAKATKPVQSLIGFFDTTAIANSKKRKTDSQSSKGSITTQQRLELFGDEDAEAAQRKKKFKPSMQPLPSQLDLYNALQQQQQSTATYRSFVSKNSQSFETESGFNEADEEIRRQIRRMNPMAVESAASEPQPKAPVKSDVKQQPPQQQQQRDEKPQTSSSELNSVTLTTERDVRMTRKEQNERYMKEAYQWRIRDPHVLQEIEHARKSQNLHIFNNIISTNGQQKNFAVALRAFAELIKSGLHPSVYTYTNLINACVRCDELDRAEFYLREMEDHGVAPNEVTYTSLIKGLTQNAKIQKAMEILSEMKAKAVLPNIRTFNTILRGCWRNGDRKTAERMFVEMHKLKITPDTSSYEYLIKTLCQHLKVDNAWKLIAKVKEMCPNPSIYSVLAVACSLTGDIDLSKQAISLARSGIIQYRSSRTFDGTHAVFAEHQMEEVERECIKVEEYLSKLESGQAQQDFAARLASERAIFLPRPQKDRLDMSSIFPERKTGSVQTRRPLKLEICSGHGDWIVERSKSEPFSDWVALEMRYERVFQIISKMIFAGIPNMLVLGGEAHRILNDYIEDNTFDEIYINYPDPPVWEGSSQTLVDKAFLLQIHRSLRDGGVFTFVTDDALYAKQTADQFKDLFNLFRSAFGKRLISDELPASYGSSYFDRMWKHGNRVKRYFLRFNKI